MFMLAVNFYNTYVLYILLKPLSGVFQYSVIIIFDSTDGSSIRMICTMVNCNLPTKF